MSVTAFMVRFRLSVFVFTMFALISAFIYRPAYVRVMVTLVVVVSVSLVFIFH